MGDGHLSETFPEIREAVRRLCARFPGEYWQKLDRESGYRGTKYPPSVVVAGIFDAIERRRHETVVPKSPLLMLGRLVRLLAPRLARAGAARMDPVSPELVEQARARAGLRGGRDRPGS